MAGALGVVLTGDTVRVEGSHAIPVYVDDSLPIVGPSRACVISDGSIPFAGGPPLAVRIAPAGTPAIGPAIPVYVVPGGGILDTLAYTNKVKAIAPANLIAYWPQGEPSGTVIVDESGNARNGVYTGVTLGQPGIGDGRTAASYDGATSFGNVYGASLAAAFNGQEGTFAMWLKVSGAGVWTDGISRRAILFQVDANNRVGINKAVANNDVDWLYVAGGTTKSGGVVAFSPLTFFHIGLTWSKVADQVKFYVNGVQSGATQTALGTFAGSLSSTQTILGSLSTTPAQVWSGLEADVAVWNTPLTAAQIAALAVVP